jgi:sphingomyelin phosphodiesterase
MSDLNSGWRLLQIDSETFSVINAQTYFANISDSLTWTEPVWELEYDTRAAYGSLEWPVEAPLNATFWHETTESMLKNTTLLEIYSTLETKSSMRTEVCDTISCVSETVCKIRSGSGVLAALCL